MLGYEQFSQQPILFILAVLSAIFTIGYFWGKRDNKNLFQTIFNELIDVLKPEDQEFGNIGGTSEYYADFKFRKDSPLTHVDAKVTLLPRHLLPYLPIAILRDKYDKLLIALHMKRKPGEGGHLIEVKYAKSRMAKITNADQLDKGTVKWGKYDFRIYCKSAKTRDMFKEFIAKHRDPGGIKHIEFVPGKKKCFIFMIPQKGQVAKDLTPVYQWILSLIE